MAQSPEFFGEMPQGQPQRQRLTPEQIAEHKTKRMKESLNLSDEQVVAVAAINTENALAEQVAREEMRELMAKMREAREAREAALDAKLKEILSDSQYKKWLKQKQQQQNRMQQGFQGGMPGGGFPGGMGGGGFEGGFGGGMGF